MTLEASLPLRLGRRQPDPRHPPGLGEGAPRPAGPRRRAQTRAASEGMEAWVVARDRDDYAAFRPWLDRHLELKREYIACFEPADDPYDILLDDYEPGMRTAEVRAVFDRLREELVPLIARDGRHGRRRPSAPARSRRPARSALGIAVMTAFGYDPESFRLDSTVHPFCSSLRHERHPRDHAVPTTTTSSRSSAACTRSATGSTSAASARRSSARRSPRAARPACTRARAACGRTWSAARCRSAAGCYPRLEAPSRARSAALDAERLPPRRQQGAALAHPGRRRRGHLRHAHHPPLRARAGADRGHARDCATCPRRGTRASRTTSGSRCRTTAAACCRTSTGRAGCSATSRRTSSAT